MTRQPLVGIASTLVVVATSFAFISLFDRQTLTGWVSYYLMCTIPAGLIVGVVWADKYPGFAVRYRQPLRGIVLLTMALAVGLAVAAVHFFTVGGAVAPPPPILVQHTIVSVVVAMWMTIIWDGLPFTRIRSPLLAGVGLLIGYYVVAYVVFHILVGLFDAFSVVGFCVTAAAIKFLMLHFELWPLSRYPGVMRQPVLGLAWMGTALLFGGILYAVCAHVLGMAPLVVLTTLSIPFIFGSIVVLNMLGGALFARLAQPAKGAASALVAAAVGGGLSLMYRSLAPILTGPVHQGPPDYALEIWLASALLAVTFPFLGFHADLFQMWPFAANRQRPKERKSNEHQDLSHIRFARSVEHRCALHERRIGDSR